MLCVVGVIMVVAVVGVVVMVMYMLLVVVVVIVVMCVCVVCVVVALLLCRVGATIAFIALVVARAAQQPHATCDIVTHTIVMKRAVALLTHRGRVAALPTTSNNVLTTT